MIIAAIGDVHGRAYHMLDALLRWQHDIGRPFDLVVQLGDLGVLPHPETGEVPYDRFSQWDPAVYDVANIVLAEGDDARSLAAIRAQLPGPILVVAGNHDEFAGYRSSPDEPVALDPHDLFHAVPDGHVVSRLGETVGFFQGQDPAASLGEKKVTVLVSHEGGFGEGAEADELSPGPPPLLRYLEEARPRFHLFGHFHHRVGPRMVFGTSCVQLASVVTDPRRNPSQVMQAGCIGVLDTEDDSFRFLDADWLAEYDRAHSLERVARRVS